MPNMADLIWNVKDEPMLKKVIAAAIALIFIPQATAERTIIRGAQVYDVDQGQFKKELDVIISDGKIQSISPAGNLIISEDDVVHDLSGSFLLPGLSDAHVHLTSDASIHGYKRLARSTPRVTITGVRNAKRTLLAGFTTVRNVGAPGYSDVALRDAIEDGDVPGPRMLVSGPSIGITGGHCDSNLLPPEYYYRSEGVADGPWAVREKVRQNNKYGADVIKFCGTGGVLSKGTKVGAQQFTLEEMQAIVDEAHLLGLKVAVHAHGAEGIATAIEAGVDSVEHASFIDDDSIRAARKAGIYLSMDIYVSDYILGEGEAAGILEESLEKERVVGRKQRERFKAAVDAGANIAFGSDAGVYPHGQNARQFAFMVEWGMRPADAIFAATAGNADLFGLENVTGRIKPGLAADLIAVDNNPLTNIKELEDIGFVMKSGQVFKDELSLRQ